MRFTLIAIIGFLILGGGAAGAFFYFKQPAEASAGESAEDKHAAKKHDETYKKGHGEFVEMAPLVLPIIDEQGVNQVVSVVIVLEVANSDDASMVEKNSPRLKDAYIQDMYGVLNKHAALKGGVVQVGAIKDRLHRISQDVMGDGIIQDVLLQVVQQRRI